MLLDYGLDSNIVTYDLRQKLYREILESDLVFL
jgi:hypothetical protein